MPVPTPELSWCEGTLIRSFLSTSCRHPGCDCPQAYFGDQCQFMGGTARVVDDGPNDRKGLVTGLTIVMLLLAMGVFLTLYLRRKGTTLCGPGNNHAVETAPAPTMENFHEVDPWKAEGLFDEDALSDDGDGYDDVDLTEQEYSDDYDDEEGILPRMHYDQEEESAQDFDTSFSVGAYEDGTVTSHNVPSEASSITMDAADEEARIHHDGPVMLMKTDNASGSAVVLTSGSGSSITSTQSEQLHVFNDSLDGSEEKLV